jgi:hypothetical protein
MSLASDMFPSMTPDHRSRAKARSRAVRAALTPPTTLSRDAAHKVVFFRRHPDADTGRASPGRDALNSFPTKVRATTRAVLAAVAAAPPKSFAGGGYWEAMHGTMTGWFEIRVDGPGRTHHRLFCLLDYEAENTDKPYLTVVAGASKAFRTTLDESFYLDVCALGDEYRARNPRSLYEGGSA